MRHECFKILSHSSDRFPLNCASWDIPKTHISCVWRRIRRMLPLCIRNTGLACVSVCIHRVGTSATVPIQCIVTCEGAHEFVYDRSGLSLSTPYSTISASHRTSPLQYQIWTCHSSYHIMEALVILTMPHASASCVLRIRLVNMSFIARSLPTACARYCDSLPPVIVPMFAFGLPNLAMGAARSRFAISASLHSPPICTYEDTW